MGTNPWEWLGLVPFFCVIELIQKEKPVVVEFRRPTPLPQGLVQARDICSGAGLASGVVQASFTQGWRREERVAPVLLTPQQFRAAPPF